jgi:hypothetical protein
VCVCVCVVVIVVIFMNVFGWFNIFGIAKSVLEISVSLS